MTSDVIFFISFSVCCCELGDLNLVNCFHGLSRNCFLVSHKCTQQLRPEIQNNSFLKMLKKKSLEVGKEIKRLKRNYVD